MLRPYNIYPYKKTTPCQILQLNNSPLSFYNPFVKYDHDVHKRQSIRLKGYDYSQQGAYFVTICTWQSECLFGDITDGEMVLNDTGGMINKWWIESKNKYKNIELDEYMIMPNHFHGIIMINNCRGEVTSPWTCKGGETPPLHKPTLGQIVAYFKYQSTKQINISRNTQGHPVWQRNYYEHVIRDEKELYAIRKYIQNNPLNWDDDNYNPINNLL